MSTDTYAQLIAAADRLHALYHAEPEGSLSAGVLSESDAPENVRHIAADLAKEICDLSKAYSIDWLSVVEPRIVRASKLQAQCSESDAVRRERELIEAKREGATRALAYFKVYEATKAGHDQRAEWIATVFPYPRVERPLRVTLSCGAVFSHEPRYTDDNCPFRIWSGGEQNARYTAMGVSAFIKTGADLAALAHIQTGVTELVEGCDDAGR